MLGFQENFCPELLNRTGKTRLELLINMGQGAAGFKVSGLTRQPGIT